MKNTMACEGIFPCPNVFIGSLHPFTMLTIFPIQIFNQAAISSVSHLVHASGDDTQIDRHPDHY